MTGPELNQLFEFVLEQLPIGLIITDSNGEIVFVNQTAEKVRKISRENILGSNVIHCHPRSAHDNVSRAINNMRNNPGINYKRMVEDNLSSKYYINTYSSIVDRQNEFCGMVVLSEDITEKRNLEKERAKLSQIQSETINNIKLQYHSLLVSSLESISSLLEARDVYTQDHSKNVCRISQKLYEHKYGINEEYNEITTAAILHDIGKICIPDRILAKPSALSDIEFETVKRHSAIAESIIKPIEFGGVSKIIRHHHERYDGKGYTDGLTGDAIPLGSRIIAIADAFDAMHSDRPYRKAMPFNECVEEIRRQSGKQFDPEWVEVFCELAMTGSL